MSRSLIPFFCKSIAKHFGINKRNVKNNDGWDGVLSSSNQFSAKPMSQKELSFCESYDDDQRLIRTHHAIIFYTYTANVWSFLQLIFHWNIHYHPIAHSAQKWLAAFTQKFQVATFFTRSITKDGKKNNKKNSSKLRALR